jgi:D-lactate dehydrogenase
MFSARPYDVDSFEAAMRTAGAQTNIRFLDVRLTRDTVSLAAGAPAVCAFVNDQLDAAVLDALATAGTRCVALRSAGYNNVDLAAAARAGITVVRVPAYSPNAVAEHTLALILALNRRIHRAYARVREGNFALDGLVGFDLAGKTVTVVGTGRIGTVIARLLWHLRCRVLAVDTYHDPHLLELGVEYVDLATGFAEADVITLNCPLTPQTHHLVNKTTIGLMRPGVMVVNTGRGALVDTVAVIDALKSHRIGSLALDVYEEEGDLFFEDRSAEVIDDDTFARLLTFPNVLLTAHQGFLTAEALSAIATTTLDNVCAVLAGEHCPNTVTATADE